MKKRTKITLNIAFVLVVFIILSPVYVLAHRSGCHRWHSCPSDSGSYVCGDAGHPCQYPTYPASGGVIYPSSGYYRDCYNCPLKEVPISTENSIKEEINKATLDYYKNPHWFREKLITKITKSLKVSTSMAAFYIYTILPDVK